MSRGMGRTIAACLGLFTLGGVDASEAVWWIDLRPAPQELALLVGLLLICHAVRPNRGTRLGVAVLAAIATCNAVAFYGRALHAKGPVPFSLLVACVLLLVLFDRSRTLRVRRVAVTAAALIVAFPLAQVFCFGQTDYRRAADAIVVFGAKCHLDGSPSTALSDRMHTACALYHQGLAPRLLLSGGPGEGQVHETEAMRAVAHRLGVPDEAIDVDRDGLNTRLTVAHTTATRVLAVSQSWHLPRIKLTYRRAGTCAFTVPARTSTPIPQTPVLVGREILAFWWYWLTARA